MFVIRERLYAHPVYLERSWPTNVQTPKNPCGYCSGQINVNESGSAGFEQGEICTQKLVRKITARASFYCDPSEHKG